MKTLTLSPQEIQLLLACIAKQPYEAVAGLVESITRQLNSVPAPVEPPVGEHYKE